MNIKTRGVVIHATKYSETSLIVNIYTERLGLLAFIVKGVRTSKSKTKAALLQPLTILEMEFAHRENRGLQFIKEFHRAYNYETLPFDVRKSTVALFLLEVISKCIKEHEENAEMFEFIYETLVTLDEASRLNPDFHLLFLVHFARYLGFMPHDNYSDEAPYFEMTEGVFTGTQGMNMLDKKESALLFNLIKSNIFSLQHLQLTRGERKNIMKRLLKYYQLHTENFNLRSPEILEEILD